MKKRAVKVSYTKEALDAVGLFDLLYCGEKLANTQGIGAYGRMRVGKKVVVFWNAPDGVNNNVELFLDGGKHIPNQLRVFLEMTPSIFEK